MEKTIGGSSKMIEKMLVTSEINGSELLRSLTLRGKNLFGFRIMTPVSLAETALIRCADMPDRRRMKPEEQPFIILRLMRQVAGYFAGISSLQDAINLSAAMNSIRLRFETNESEELHQVLPNGEFPDKNAALLEIYDRYMAWLTENGVIDDIGLMRYALDRACTLDAELLFLEEFEISPLEKALVSHLSGGMYQKTSLQELFGTQPSSDLRIDSLTEVYGAVNEVDQLIKDIYDRQIPLDRCVVAVTDARAYGRLFYELAVEKGIPAALGMGISVADTRPAGLLNLWTQWNGIGFHGVDALQAMIYSDSFDRSIMLVLLNEGRTEDEGPVSLRRLTELAGKLRLEQDRYVNEQRIAAWRETLSDASEDLKWVDALKTFGRELALSCSAFLMKYVSLRQHPVGGPLDKSALRAIVDMLDMETRFPGIARTEDLIPIALDQTVMAEQATPGHLYITTIEGALSVQRDHLFILGMSADVFPGRPTENALVLDSDWQLLPDPDSAPTSRNRIRQSRNRLTVLVQLAASLNIDVHLYWPGIDLTTLKKMNPSSAVYDLRRRFPAIQTRKIGYFPAIYSESYAAARLYLEGRPVSPEKATRCRTKNALPNPRDREWSPSAIDTWFSCKRKFLYQYILNLDAEEADNPMTVIPAADIGNLAHHLMERLAASHPGREEFGQLAADMFDTYLIARPPMDPFAGEREKKRFLRMMDSAWDHDPGRKVLLSEETMHSSHPSGLTLYGRPDRVELDENGDGIVVDFKTGYKVMQEPNDPASCRQTLIYAWMLRQNGIPIKRCEYRYLRSSQDVVCGADQDMMEKLEEDLILFSKGVRHGDYAPEDGYGKSCEEQHTCDYCPYAQICALDLTPEEEALQ